MTDTSFGGSWADEVEDTYGSQPLPAPERRAAPGAWGDRGFHVRDPGPQQLPEKAPFTAHLGNLSYDVTSDAVSEFFEGCDVINVRIVEDREQQRPKGFGYAEFADVEGLKKALTMDGETFQGRNIRIRVADPPKDREGRTEMRDIDWTRRGPLPDLPNRGGDRRGPADFADRRPSRDAPADDGRVRDLGSWERKGPLAPLPQQEPAPGSRDGSRPRTNEGGRSESYRGDRRASPAAWGEGRQEGSRPPRREFTEPRPERVPTAAERDMQWRTSMRPDAPVKSPTQSRSGSEAPPSPAPAAAVPASRPKLNLAKRTVSGAPDVTSPALPSATDSKASPFGAARPIDSAAREREIEEKRQAALKEKKEADEKAKEERRLAKEAAAQQAAEKQEVEASNEEAQPKVAEEAAQEPPKEAEAAAPEGQNGGDGEQKAPLRPREPKENVQNAKSRATESGNWRSASGDQRGARGPIPSGPRRGGGAPRGPRDGPRAPRANGSSAPAGQQAPAQSSAEPAQKTTDEEGWETVPNKGRRNQRGRVA